MNDLAHIPAGVSLTQPKSPWFDVHPALGISPIDHLYNRMDGAYPIKWRSNFTTSDSIRNWAESWVEAFEESGITYQMIRDGIKVCRQKHAWPPSCAEFIQACRPSIDPLQAYYEAVAGIQARDRGEMGAWSHPAVFWAAAGMAYELKSSTYSQVRTQWERSLSAQLAKTDFEEIRLPGDGAVKAIGYVKKELTREEAQKRIEDLGAAGLFNPKGDSKDWARKILVNPKNRPLIAVKFAKEALGLDA